MEARGLQWDFFERPEVAGPGLFFGLGLHRSSIFTSSIHKEKQKQADYVSCNPASHYYGMLATRELLLLLLFLTQPFSNIKRPWPQGASLFLAFLDT